MARTIKDMLVRTYDQTVKEYVCHEFNNPAMEKHYQKFLSFIPKKSKILDVGCGPGQASKKFTDKGHEVIGIDLSEKMIDFAKKKVTSANFYVMDVENITLKNKFDAIWAAFILIHIPRKRHLAILKKFFDLLKPRGVLYLGLLEGKGEKIIPEPYNRRYKQYFVWVSKEETKDNLSKVGFNILEYSTEEFNEEGNLFILSSTFAKRSK
ncbi:MAG: class I SAM-dependent methyltransferase [Nanoarchaeota archaeon]